MHPFSLLSCSGNKIKHLICCHYYLIFTSLYQQNNMYKTFRSSSLPQLKLVSSSTKTRVVEQQAKPNKKQPSQPHSIGEYSFFKEDLLGKGFCSQVYKGIHTKTGTQVALKLIQFDKIRGNIQKRLVKNEIKNWNQVKDHQNIVKLHQIITTGEYVAFVTELCRGSLLQKLKSNNAYKKEPLLMEEALKVLREVLVGYYWMREHGLLHRDIKPANVLIGQDGEARLGDFGFSTRDEEVDKDRNVNIGSPLYMAPEVLKGNNYSSKADMWSIGLIFLETLIGDLPWLHVKECNLHEKLLQVNFLECIPEDVQEKYKVMLIKCLELDPRKRMGVREMMGYLFTQQELMNLTKSQEKATMLDDKKSLRSTNISIPTTITEMEEQKRSSPKGESSSKLLSPAMNRTGIHKLSNNFVTRSFKDSYSRKTARATEQSSKNQAILNMKLKVKGPQELDLIGKQQMSELHFSRFMFKVIQLIAKGKDNIHCTYLDLDDDVSIKIAQSILFTLEHIREIKGQHSSAVVKEFRKTKEYHRILELVERYENNYLQFFQIRLNQAIEARPIDADFLIEMMSKSTAKGRQHFSLILQQVEKSQLRVISDDEICEFSYLLDSMSKLLHLLRLKKKGKEYFLKYSKIQELSCPNPTSISLLQMRKIHERLQT